METGDIITVIFTVFLLLIVGYAIYAYVMQTPYYHYAGVISIAAVLVLIYITKSSVYERNLDLHGPNTPPYDSRRFFRWNADKPRDGGKRKHKRS